MSHETKHDHTSTSQSPKIAPRRYQWKPQNIGTIDRLIRAALGVFFLSSIFIASRATTPFFGFTTDNFPYFYATLLGFYPALTAILGWDPLYQVFRVRSSSSVSWDVSGTVKEQLDAVVGELKPDSNISR